MKTFTLPRLSDFKKSAIDSKEMKYIAGGTEPTQYLLEEDYDNDNADDTPADAHYE